MVVVVVVVVVAVCFLGIKIKNEGTTRNKIQVEYIQMMVKNKM